MALHPPPFHREWSLGWVEAGSCLVGVALGFLVILASGLAYALWNRAIAGPGAVRTNHYVYLVPQVNTALAALFLGEPLTPLTVLGSALIVAEVFGALRRTTLRR